MCVCVCVCIQTHFATTYILHCSFFFFRLLYHDMNSATSSVPEKEFHMSLPNYSLYSDLHAGVHHTFPPVSSNRLVEFLASCEKKFDSKIEDLYKERYGICVYT